MNPTQNYMTPTNAQLLGGQMMPLNVQNAAPVPQSNPMGGVPQMSPQAMQAAMSALNPNGGLMGLGMNSTQGYVDANGDSVAAGSPGATLANNAAYSYGPQESGLSAGTQFSPSDLSSLASMFGGGADTSGLMGGSDAAAAGGATDAAASSGMLDSIGEGIAAIAPYFAAMFA